MNHMVIKRTFCYVLQTKTQLSLRIHAVSSELSLTHEETLNPCLFEMRRTKILIILRKRADWSESSQSAHVGRYVFFLRCGSCPEVIKHFSCSTQLSMKFFLVINLKLLTIANSFWLNVAEHEIFSANKYENANYCWHIVGIFIFISRENIMLSWVEHEKSFILPRDHISNRHIVICTLFQERVEFQHHVRSVTLRKHVYSNILENFTTKKMKICR